MKTSKIPLPSETVTMLITPGIAADWLLRNTGNRPLRKRYAAALARDMSEGRWRFAAGTISFRRGDGALMDGQHRLEAVVLSGTDQFFLVVPNLDPEDMDVMDTGVKRTVGDALALGEGWEGVPARVAAAVARVGFQIDAGDFGMESAPTNPEMIEWARAHPQIKTHVIEVNRHAKKFMAPTAVVGYAMYRLAEIDTFKAAEFFDDWKELRTDGRGDPLAALIQRLRSAQVNKEKLSRPAVLNGIYRTWNARRGGENLERLLLATRAGQRIERIEPK